MSRQWVIMNFKKKSIQNITIFKYPKDKTNEIEFIGRNLHTCRLKSILCDQKGGAKKRKTKT